MIFHSPDLPTAAISQIPVRSRPVGAFGFRQFNRRLLQLVDPDAANSASIMIRAAMPINVGIPVDLPLLVDMAMSEPVEMAVTA